MRIRGSVILATVIAIAAVAWIASGQIGETPATASQTPPPGVQEALTPSPTRVRVRDLTADHYVAHVISSGQTEASRIITVRAETAGRIVETPAKKGAYLRSGDLIVRIDQADRPARLAEAKARIVQREMEYNAASQLAAKGFQSETIRAGARAELEAAKAERRSIEVDLARTSIIAPVQTVLDDRVVEIGDYVSVGDPIATIVELDPLLVTANVTERQAPLVEVGMPAKVRLSNGDAILGIVRYVSAIANEETRTFRIEIEIDNSSNRYGQGLTAGIEIDLPPVLAHAVSPSIFRLDEQGRMGVMTVDAENRARFSPIVILGVDARGTWVRGLPDSVRVITVGQELIDDGETVEPVAVQPEAPTS